ncbi:hypothetical protein ACIRL2_29220 [Embleya sp. NPDC127516]|uniref:zinc finger domain-containing protein n=1 Tax=Embleya sp. NPDC127516 TaxID=3363990 RepID=UPI0037F9DD00
MKKSEIAQLLTLAASFDLRIVGDADVAAWHLILGKVDYTDAQAAVLLHYRDETRRIMPADVRRHVRQIRNDRAEHNGGPVMGGTSRRVPQVDPDDHVAYRAALREERRLLASDLAAMPELAALLDGAGERLSIERVTVERVTMQRPSVRAYSVPCRHCHADPGDRCVTRVHGAPLTDPHDSRVDDAHAAAAARDTAPADQGDDR